MSTLIAINQLFKKGKKKSVQHLTDRFISYFQANLKRNLWHQYEANGKDNL